MHWYLILIHSVAVQNRVVTEHSKIEVGCLSSKRVDSKRHLRVRRFKSVRDFNFFHGIAYHSFVLSEHLFQTPKIFFFCICNVCANARCKSEETLICCLLHLAQRIRILYPERQRAARNNRPTFLTVFTAD